MNQIYPDTPGVIYRILDADPEFSSYIGTYKFANNQVENAISMLTPGSNIPGVQSVAGVECIIHDISDVKRIDFLTDSSTLINEWKVFLVAWDPATGEDLNNAVRRIMELFRGATSMQTVRTSEGFDARVQTVVTIPSNQPLDIDGMAIYGPQPTITLNSNLNYILPGQDVTIAWQISSALRATLSEGIGNIPLTGSQLFTVDKSTTFTINAENDFTSASAGIEISVLDPIVAMFDFERIGSTNQYTFSWATSHAQEVRFNGRYDWPLSGSATLTVIAPAEFILEAYSTQGKDQASIIIAS
jgi:hypothetical protein